MGFGLLVLYGIVECYCGVIDVISELGCGMIFWIWLLVWCVGDCVDVVVLE